MNTVNLTKSKNWDLGDKIQFTTIVALEEISLHDMVYIYHHIQVGTPLALKISGENVKGERRYSVYYRQFLLGYITITGPLSTIYKDLSILEAEVIHFEKKKFLPITKMDLSVQATKMRMVS
jgi:hypothetical protein